MVLRHCDDGDDVKVVRLPLAYLIDAVFLRDLRVVDPDKLDTVLGAVIVDVFQLCQHRLRIFIFIVDCGGIDD